MLKELQRIEDVGLRLVEVIKTHRDKHLVEHMVKSSSFKVKTSEVGK